MPAKKKKEFNLAGFAKSAMEAAQGTVGQENVYVAADHDKRQFGFHIPTFALRYLINNTVWPLQRVSSCGGPPKGHKSSFAYQLQRWVLDAGGMVTHIETENKATSDIQKSIVGPKYMDPNSPDAWRVSFVNTRTINEWQQVLTKQHELLQKVTEDSGSKPCIPIMWNIDTLMGADTEEQLSKLKDTGEAMGRGYSDAPMIISNFLRQTSAVLLGWPICLHLTHQEKNAIGGIGKTRAGGIAPDFYTSIDLQFSLGGTSAYSKSYKIDRANMSGFNVKMKVRKSSIGPSGREMTVPFIWRFLDEVDSETGEKKTRQEFQFDWNAATAELLANMPIRSISDIMRVESEQTRAGKVYSSDALGVKKTSPLSGAEFGAALEANTELMAALENHLVIKQGQLIGPGILD